MIVNHDAAEGDPQERDRAEAGTEDGTEDGASSCDIEQLDQERPPAGDAYIIHTVCETGARGLGRTVDACEAFEIAAIGEIGGNEEG